ncbi:MAG TPA: hypothetical protein VLQ93_19635 [Myxococcaceae bacterium]|nr:hypothetical protein [Myxococcaceae bacterium]
MKRADEVLLVNMARVTHRTRAVLVALAQRGKMLRQEHPTRAQCMLSVAVQHPFYKSGKLVFQMAEVAEALREGPPPPHLDDEVLSQIMRPMAAAIDVSDVLAACRAASEGIEEEAASSQSRASLLAGTSWPQLERSESLFELIALGVVEMLCRLHPEPEQARESKVSSA